MAQRAYGIDLGTHSIKIAQIDIGFRSIDILRLDRYPVLLRKGDLFGRSLAAFPGSFACGEHDLVSVGIPGDQAASRLMDVPVEDPRKVRDIIGLELSDELPWEFDDIVYDYISTTRRGKVFVSATPKEVIQRVLAQLAAKKISPQHFSLSPLAYGGIIQRIGTKISPILLLDLGHTRTNLCAFDQQRPILSRTISRGGENITEAIRTAFHLTHAEALQIKHDRAVLTADPATLGVEKKRLSEVCIESFSPLLREIHRSISLIEDVIGTLPKLVLITGGTSLLSGIGPYLELELGLETRPLLMDSESDIKISLSREQQAYSTSAIGIALESRRAQNIDFRQGRFASAAGRSFVREKLWPTIIGMAAILLFALLDAWLMLGSLRREEGVLKRDLRQATARLFRHPTDDPGRAGLKLKRAIGQQHVRIPEMTAADILELFSKNVPAEDKIKLDVSTIDIKPKKTTVEGTVDSLSAVGKTVALLKKVKCFENVIPGKISEVAGGKKQFSLTIKTRCF